MEMTAQIRLIKHGVIPDCGSYEVRFPGALSELSTHFTAGSSQPMHWKAVQPEIVTTGTVSFPHFGQRVIRSMRSSRFFSPTISSASRHAQLPAACAHVQA